jgi:hypothetical protein
VYSGFLSCESPAVGQRRLPIPLAILFKPLLLYDQLTLYSTQHKANLCHIGSSDIELESQAQASTQSTDTPSSIVGSTTQPSNNDTAPDAPHALRILEILSHLVSARNEHT